MLTVAVDTAFVTKNELGDDYGRRLLSIKKNGMSRPLHAAFATGKSLRCQGVSMDAEGLTAKTAASVTVIGIIKCLELATCNYIR
jgi:hypothetical protein